MKFNTILTLAIVLIIGLTPVQSTVAQKASSSMTQQDVKVELNKAFASFVESLRPFYTSRDTYDSFKRKVILGTTSTRPALPLLPKEGERMLKKAFDYLKLGLTTNQIIAKGEYKIMGAAALYVNNQVKSQSKPFDDVQANLLGGSVLVNTSNPYNNSRSGGCCFFCFRCHLQTIFGDEGGDLILHAIIDFIKDLLK